MSNESILQFGGGNFLRGFVDVFAHDAGIDRGIVIVQSTRSGVAEQINRQGGRYHVVTRGLRDGRPVDEVTEVASVARAIDAQSDWASVLAVAASPEASTIVSNTTEAGLALDPADVRRTANSPASFPAKLLACLCHRYDAGQRDRVTVFPCELLPKNGEKLRDLVLQQAAIWRTPAGVVDFVRDGCVWPNSLVDRIVSGKPASHPLLATDPLLTVAEPYALWAIDGCPAGALFAHPAIEHVADTAAYELRKVRVLNGCHTALVAKAMPLGVVTVRDAVQHADVGPWLRGLLEEEILPTLDGRAPNLRAFADSTLDRFANPYLDHKLSSIALNHEAKLKTRLLPTRDEFVARFGRRPKRLDAILGG